MGFKLFKSASETFKFIHTYDEAVVRETDEQRANCEKYLETLDRSLLTLRGEPFVWRLRPLTYRILEIAQANVKGRAGVVEGALVVDTPTARELCRLCICGVENWPESEPKFSSFQLYDYDMKILEHEFVDQLPTAFVRELAAVLLDTLFVSPSNKEKGKGEVNKDAVPGN